MRCITLEPMHFLRAVAADRSPWRTLPTRHSRSNTSRRHYGCPLACAPRTGDGRLVPAGLLARGSCASPPPSRRSPGSGIGKRRSPLTVAGAAAALGIGPTGPILAPRSLFTWRGPAPGRDRNRHARVWKGDAGGLVNGPPASNVGYRSRDGARATVADASSSDQSCAAVCGLLNCRSTAVPPACTAAFKAASGSSTRGHPARACGPPWRLVAPFG